MEVIKIIEEKHGKVNRVLTIYSRLIEGNIVNKKEMARLFRVTEKTIQRDLDDIRAYFSDNWEYVGFKDIVYKYDKNGYSLNNKEEILTKEDILAITKILLESRAFCIEELKHLTNSILMQTDIKQRKYINEIIGSELLNYVPLKHNSLVLEKIWKLSELIRNKEVTQITYTRADDLEVRREVKPVSIVFSEYYFYLIGYSNDFDSPTVYRIDRIKEYESVGEKFYIPHSERFEDGEFRKRVQFMYPGKLIKINFEFTGNSVEAILDRLPTAKIIEKVENKVIIEAEVYGKGIMMWILGQGSRIKVREPKEFVDEITEEINKMQKLIRK